MDNELIKNIHVINLDRSQDRLKLFDENMKKYNLNYKRFKAVDGKKLNLKDIKKSTTNMCRSILCNRSIIGCALSHILLWKQISESTDKWHFIIEDDIHLNDKALPYLDKLKKEILNEDDIIISLQCTGPLCFGGKSKFSQLHKPVFPLGTCAYLITKNTAKKLYDYFKINKINYHLDNQMAFNISSLNIKRYTTSNNVIINTGDNNSTVSNNSLWIMGNVLNKLGLSNINWMFSVPILTIDMQYTINFYMVLFVILLLLNIFVFNSILLYIYLLLEFTLSFIIKF
ncbi:MAG: glycosyltransferase family 25 [Edafosvirus sp.]|uniref:Glycosyltransferase family 25 n=1 Tax=Edafosvirus sp. TaxID=2487765 RepID=A0A3G4ZSW4_9VIRU|nr:MAG: glycosyltransferase family 25 [Edafosvirus sp.]